MKNVANTVVKKKRFSFKRLLILLLFIYILGYSIYYVFSLPIKNIYITGTNRISDYEIITTAGIKKYPSIFKISKNKMVKKISVLELVKSVDISKSLLGKLEIDITENKILFYQKSSNKCYLESGQAIDNNNYLGVPVLINYVPDELFSELVTSFSKIDNNILKQISEIEYNPYRNSKGEIIDAERFLLRMSDGNTVYVNLVNIKKMNLYEKIYLTLEGKGILYLDSEEEEKVVFNIYE